MDLVLVRGGFSRKVGLTGAGQCTSGALEGTTEVAYRSFAIRLTLGKPPVRRQGPIEHFAQFGPDERREVWLYTIAGHVTIKFPGDYRSPEHIDNDAANREDR